MSSYSENKTQFKDAKLLCAALQEMGFNASDIEIHSEAQPLIGLGNRQTHYVDSNGDTAHVIIRKDAVMRVAGRRVWNDIGFKRDALTGTYSAILERDSGYTTPGWLMKVSVNYAKRNLIQTAQKQGYRLANNPKSVNSKTELLFVKA